jgi:ABC-type polysaccharide/polyol phosphate export permease
MVKGLFASLLIIVVGLIASPHFSVGGLFFPALLLNGFLFANLGVIIGMRTKTHEDTATYTNFLIMPMAFFSGTFFPVDRIPGLLKALVYVMPLTHTNILIRKAALDGEALVSLLVLVLYSLVFSAYGARLIHGYNE